MIDSPLILSMRMLIILCPWALFESKFCIIFSVSFSVNVIFDRDLSVLGCRKNGISLPLSIIEHCLEKKELNNSAFSLKLVTNLFSRKIGEIQGIFYYYGITLVLTNMFWELWNDPLIFPINENNISAWMLQWKPLVNSE